MTINFSAADPNFDSDLYAMLTWFEGNGPMTIGDRPRFPTNQKGPLSFAFQSSKPCHIARALS